MEKAERNKKILVTNFIVVVLLAIVLLVLLNLTITVDEDGFQCLNDPLGYGAIKLTEANKAEFSCSCRLAKENSPTLYFDSQGKDLIYPKNPATNLNDHNIDFANIIIDQE